MKTWTFLVLSILFITGCVSEYDEEAALPTVRATHADATPGAASIPAAPVDTAFGNYWYQGKAELTSYTLEQARYGEMRPGKAVLIFVTEDFSRKKQVKLDDYQSAGDDAVKVMKLNLTKNFNTGIYPYSMMSSIFTPVYGDKGPHTLKVTTSSQEWCGHTFSQINLKGDTYRVQLHSYFESEGEQTVDLDRVMLEDEVWNKIRLNPEALPTGEIQIIAGTMFQRLGHTDFEVETAQASLEAVGDDEKAYTLAYQKRDRALTIRFKTAFPHEITGWEETYSQGRGAQAKRLTTRATRAKSIMLPYWRHNSTADDALRAELNLD